MKIFHGHLNSTKILFWFTKCICQHFNTCVLKNEWHDWIIHLNQSNPLFCALLHQCRFGCYALFSAESGLLFVKLFKAWQDLRGLVYWETVWSEGLTSILGLSLIACVLLAWSDAQSRQCWTSHWERESVRIEERGEKSIIPQQENALQKLNPFILADLSLVFLFLPAPHTGCPAEELSRAH